jgi:arylsulfatase A-like enzyme
MNILYIDIDSLRPDHLGCYGYHRNTSPNIDALAAEGVRFSRAYCPDAPCLPSRTAMTTGRFGIHTGVVNHGGVACQPHVWGPDRGFGCNLTEANWANRFRESGYHTVAFSPFAQRHGAWHWYAGFMEMHNTGGNGMEIADEIHPQVSEWLERRMSPDAKLGGDRSKPFFMWVNVWDPHTPYRTPAEFGNPFAEDPLPDWYTPEVFEQHRGKAGPHAPQEALGFDDEVAWWMAEGSENAEKYPNMLERQPLRLDSMEDVKRFFDGYDQGVAYADRAVGRIVQKLKDLGLYEDTAIIVSADHGENLGELWVYGDHQTADEFTHHIPMVVRWPGLTDSRAGEVDDRLMYSLDMAATSLECAGIGVPDNWDGASFAGDWVPGKSRNQRDHLVLSQMAWCAQRSARWDHYLVIETDHDAYHDYPRHMVFDLEADPHEQVDLARERPDLLARGREILDTWRTEMLATAVHKVDPRETVMAEGGPLHIRGEGARYIQRLKETGRTEIAERFEARRHAWRDPES